MTRPNQLAGLAALFGLALGLCALVSFAVAVKDERTTLLHSSWPSVSATVERSEVQPYRPFTRDGGGLVYSVVSEVTFPAPGGATRARLASSSVRAGDDVEAMNAWVARHPPGSTLAVRFDPQAPERVVLADPEGLPMPWRPRQDALLGAVATLFAGALLIASRRLRRRSPEAE